MAFINKIGLANAPYKHDQKDILQYMLNRFEIPEREIEKIKRLYDRSEIAYRYAAIEDFSASQNDNQFYKKGHLISIEKRMKTYFEIGPKMCLEAIKKCISNDEDLQRVTHLITVSCTGMSAPGLDILLIQQLNLKNNIHRTSVNFMGCYAAIHGLKQANAICEADNNAVVLMVDLELCTLHFQDEYSMDNITSSLLFGDGCAAVIISNEKGIYELNHFYSELAFNGIEDMTWNISSHGFLMSLSAYVPNIIAENIESMLLHSLESMKLKKEDIRHWAIHPGGKKIVTEIAKALSLSENDVQVSRKILNDFGNMSSVTLLYVLFEMQQNITQKGEPIFAAAFGPGLTIETMLLQSC